METRETIQSAKNEPRITAYVVFTCLMAGSGGLMYGYDIVIAGGVSIMDGFLLKFYPSVYMHKKNANEDNYCKFDNHVFQLFNSSLYMASLLATSFASVTSRKLGRKATMLCAGIFFILGTVLSAAAQNLTMLIMGRALLGCGLGFSNQVVPVFLSEVAPPRTRGRLNAIFGLYIGTGILTGNVVNYLAAKIHPWGWRLSLGLAGVPALMLTLGSLIVVDTPSSLIERGYEEQAKEALCKLRGKRDFSIEFDALLEASSRGIQGRTTWVEYKELLCSKRHRAEVVLVCMLPLFQQAVGNDAILFYGAFLFKLAGFGDSASLYSVVITGAAGIMGGCLAFMVVDKIGRRPLLLLGCVWMFSSLVVVGSIFAAKLKGDVRKLPEVESITEVIMVSVFVFFFAMSLGPLAWLIPSEILSQDVRAAGLSVNVFVNMLIKFVIA